MEGVKHYSLGLYCTTCQIAFELSEEHRAHYKSDWHRYNLKQKIRNRQTIDEPKFLALESISYILFNLQLNPQFFCAIKFKQNKLKKKTFDN